MKRETLASRMGFILLSAGCAIGIGNVWKFPYMAGQYGGGIFVLIYLFFLAVLGIPVMTMEFAVGRGSKKSPVKLYYELEPKGSFWHIHGYAAMAGCYILLMFYSVVSGWLLRYFVELSRGTFAGKSADDVGNYFVTVLGQPVQMTIYMVIVLVLGFLVCVKGLQNGLEKITKYMMIALLVIMFVLAINSVFLDGAAEGLKFYLIPSVEQIEKAGLINIIVGAMNQSFFTLSLGIGAMAIFGSYINDERSLMGEAVNVALLDTLVALVSGLIIFPACASYNVDVNAGPALIFITLPNIFKDMPLGRIWGGLFFVFMSFAALSTVFAVFENLISCLMDLFGINRKKAAFINLIVLIIASMPCVLGYNLWSAFKPFGGDSTVLDLEDFVVSNLLLPIGSFIYILFCVSKYGWGWNNFVDEANKGKGAKIINGMRFYMTYILPLIVFILLALGLKEKFLN